MGETIEDQGHQGYRNHLLSNELLQLITKSSIRSVVQHLVFPFRSEEECLTYKLMQVLISQS
jgi:hypothetical protein